MARLGAQCLCGGLVLMQLAAAHETPHSALDLRPSPSGVQAVLRLPLSELQLALRLPLVADPDTALAAHRELLTRYVQAHVQLGSGQGSPPWPLLVEGLTLTADAQGGDLLAQLRWIAPEGADTRRFALFCDAIGHEVMNHRTLVYLGDDFRAGRLGRSARLLDTLRLEHRSTRIELDPPNALAAFAAAVALGMRHIAEGTDHLLFLLMLVLPAPLLADAGRWRGPARAGQTGWRLLRVVSAFTLGHCLTLAAAAMGWLQPPGRPVEVLIAASIAVTACHAIRPLFARQEAWIAGGFGLVHGLAFGGAIHALGFQGRDLLLCMLGFNVGMELCQLFVLACTLPWLMLLARNGAYTPLRIGLATLGGVAALGWMGERWFEWANPVAPWVEAAASHAPWALAALAVAATTAWWRTRRRIHGTPGDPARPLGC